MNAQDNSLQQGQSTKLETAIKHARSGNRGKARQILLEIVENDPSREEVWLWLAGLADDLEDSQVYLETVLALNPTHKRAKEGLELIKKRIEKEEGKQTKASQTASSPDPAPTSASMAAQPSQAMATCPGCGQSKPEDAPICPSCGYIEGKPAVEEVADLQPIPASAQAAKPPVNVNDEISPSFTLTVEQAEAIDVSLERMAYESEASCIILADVTGQLISERGKTSGFNTQVLSALAAGELSATQEMARLVGEKARFNLLLHEGEDRSVYLSPVGHKMLLIIVFDERTPIGLVRIILKNAVDELGPILARPAKESEDDFSETFSDEFAQQLEDEIDASMDFMIE